MSFQKSVACVPIYVKIFDRLRICFIKHAETRSNLRFLASQKNAGRILYRHSDLRMRPAQPAILRFYTVGFRYLRRIKSLSILHNLISVAEAVARICYPASHSANGGIRTADCAFLTFDCARIRYLK
jgi:hypothetical protein